MKIKKPAIAGSFINNGDSGDKRDDGNDDDVRQSLLLPEFVPLRYQM